MSKRIVLLTGASAGIGKDIALNLIKKGYTVYGAARRIEMMQDIEELGGKVLKLDVTDDASCQAAVDAIMKTEGRIDFLINNAGYGAFGTLEHLPMKEARRQFDVNVFGLAYLMQLVIPHMKKQRQGRIINISSVVGRVVIPMIGWYCASKHAVEALSDAARIELKQFGIKVSLIQPGVVESEFKQTAFDRLEHNFVGSDYQHMADNMIKYQENRRPAPASTVTKTVIKALESLSPAPRYIPNTDSLLSQWARRIAGDRLYDFAVTTFLGRK